MTSVASDRDSSQNLWASLCSLMASAGHKRETDLCAATVQLRMQYSHHHRHVEYHDETLATYCLKWLEKHRRFDSLLALGKYCPMDMDELLRARPALAWHVSLGRHDHVAAAAEAVAAAKHMSVMNMQMMRRAGHHHDDAKDADDGVVYCDVSRAALLGIAKLCSIVKSEAEHVRDHVHREERHARAESVLLSVWPR